MRVVAMMTALAALAGCNGAFGGESVQSSGTSGQRSFEVGSFERVELAGPFDATVTVGGAPSVTAEGDTALLDRMDVRVEGGKLVIRPREGDNWSDVRSKINVRITAPALTGADLAGSGNMRVAPFQVQNFEAAIAGSGNMVLERLQAEAAEFDIAGSGKLEANGAARRASIDIAGSGDVRLSGFQTETAEVSIAGSGNADIRATATAAVSMLGSGNVNVAGGARCEVEKMGSGSVNCG